VVAKTVQAFGVGRRAKMVAANRCVKIGKLAIPGGAWVTNGNRGSYIATIMKSRKAPSAESHSDIAHLGSVPLPTIMHSDSAASSLLQTSRQ
jgi:hypothetical protein